MSIIRILQRVYKITISPFLGARCRFYPSCSEYCCHAIEYHGLIMGTWFSLKRIIRCNPFCEGGIDNVPKNKSEF